MSGEYAGGGQFVALPGSLHEKKFPGALDGARLRFAVRRVVKLSALQGQQLIEGLLADGGAELGVDEAAAANIDAALLAVRGDLDQ